MRAQIQQDNIDGIINRISSEEHFDDVKWILDAPVRNLVQKAMDDTVQKNADFHAKAGLKPKIIRKSSGHCCEWCNQVAGIYVYPDVPKDVFRRHDNCDCIVEYYPGSGKRQNVHTKSWHDQTDNDIINARKLLGLKADDTTIKGVSEHVLKRMKERSVSSEDIIETLNNPLKKSEIKYDKEKRPSFTLIGEKSTVAINPENGVITTTHKTHSSIVRKLKEMGNEK